jgi:diacylglycerol kinase family enzyme
MDLLVHGIPRKVDVIRINDSEVCLHLGDIGLNAQLVKYFEERGLRGKLGYARGVLRVWWNRTPMRVYINDGTKRIARDAFMVVLANARMYGTGAVINPVGSIQDGIFEVIIVRRLSLIELFQMFFRKRNYDKDKIEIIPAQSVDIQVKKKAYFQVDGEYRGKTKEVKAVIQHHALCLLYPQSVVPKS